MNNKFDSFSDLLHGALGDLLAPADGLLNMFTEDVIFEFPYSPDGLPRRLDGRAALTNHLTRLAPLLQLDQFTLHNVYPSKDSVILEFSCQGEGKRTGAPYDQEYVSILTMQGGRIARYRDYWNPLVVLSALGGAEAAADAFLNEVHHD